MSIIYKFKGEIAEKEAKLWDGGWGVLIFPIKNSIKYLLNLRVLRILAKKR